MTFKKLILALILAGITAFAGSARPQQEVAPDHFDGTDVPPQAQVKILPRRARTKSFKARRSGGYRRNYRLKRPD